jgi:diacylglycerol kinase family enzyme
MGALLLGLVALGLLTVRATVDAPRGVLGIGLLALALATTWYGLVRRGALHILGFTVGALLALVLTVLLILADPLLAIGVILAVGLAVAAGSQAFRIHVPLPPAPHPTHPVVFWNPRSGGGKAQRVHLAEEARVRGIEPIELTSGASLAELVRAALDAGADALAMAGGDGSQAIVARFAADGGIPYACIPAGTRNHFALDLGVDRNDLIGALDAFVDGGERIVDLGEVNGRTFVNNVSLGVYGAAVQRAGYRDAKVRTVLETIPVSLETGEPSRLRWRSPDGVEHEGGVAIVVSNNAYRLGHVMGDGTRPRLDRGLLGVTAISVPGDEPGLRTWTTSAYEVGAQDPVPAGVDGEAVTFDPPLSFRIRHSALRCRIARQHPGASPSAFLPSGAWAAIRTLVAIAAGRDPRPVPGAGATGPHEPRT